MQCPKCGFENRGNARFCGRCGQTLPQPAPARPRPAPLQADMSANRAATPAEICPVCGASLKPGARFCARCGSPVQEAGHQPAPRDVSQQGWPAGQEMPPGAWPSPPPTKLAPPVDQMTYPAQAPYPEAGWQTPGPSVLEAEPEAVRRAPPRALAWILALLALVLSSCCFFSAILGMAVWSAFDDTVAAPPEADPSRPDLTIYVGEAYVTSMLDDALPGSVEGETTLDVQPDNLLVLTAQLELMIVEVQVIVESRMSVVDGRIHIVVEDVNAGGADIFRLIGIDGWELGDDLVDAVQQGLEEELGAGSELLDIRTDENWIILEAKLN